LIHTTTPKPGGLKQGQKQWAGSLQDVELSIQTYSNPNGEGLRKSSFQISAIFQ
jgi:hypothetical protein